ncbi:unnamed protein product [Lasius platythorax]|uniref:C2H2-type domain-containing protein n=1 Tax=Lasius platythorax TaxID=488582 RepID=A0AAV2MYH6_9HYME
MIKNMLSSNPSRYDIEDCSACGKKIIFHPTIAPNHNIIWRKSFTALQETLEFWSPVYNIHCRHSCPGKFTRTSNLNEHIIIELDIRHQKNLKKSLKCSLGEFPTTMYLGPRNQATKFEYRLAGVVEYLPGHYIAHCIP